MKLKLRFISFTTALLPLWASHTIYSFLNELMLPILRLSGPNRIGNNWELPIGITWGFTAIAILVGLFALFHVTLIKGMIRLGLLSKADGIKIIDRLYKAKKHTKTTKT